MADGERPAHSPAPIASVPPAREPAHDFDVALFALFLVHCMLFQIVTAVTRITTSYRSIELDLSYVWYGAISSGYALLPIFLAVPLGRYMGAGRDARVIWIGACLSLTANLGLWVWPANAPLLLLYTVIAGVGHLCLMAGHQMLSLRCSGPRSRESVFGWYMVVLSVGQMIGPGIVGWAAGDARLPPTQWLFSIALMFSVLTLAGAFAIRPARADISGKKPPAPVPVMEILRAKGLKTVILASVVTVTSMDVIIVYLPLLGIERHVDAWHIGVALMIRALASIGARLFYERLLRLAGRGGLSMWTMLIAAAGFIVIAIPGPLAALYLGSAMIGFGAGLAVTVCLSNVIALSPPDGRATALTLRLSGNRLGQFIVPVVASMLATVSGVGGVFILVALATAASGLSMRRVSV